MDAEGSAARIDQKAKRQLSLELWNVPHTVQRAFFEKFLNIFQKNCKVESLHNACLGNGMSDHVKGKDGR